MFIQFRVESLGFRVSWEFIVSGFKFIRFIFFISAVLMTFGSSFRIQGSRVQSSKFKVQGGG